MKHSVFEPKPDQKDVAVGYTSFALGEPEAAVLEGDGWIHAAGGLYTTPSDLLKWDQALMEGKVLKPESHLLMTTPRKLADGRLTTYGCGMSLSQRDGERLVRHSGAVSGFLAFNLMIARTKSALALMTNCDHLDASALNDVLVTLLIKSGMPEVPAVPKVEGPPAKEVALDLLHQWQSGKIQRENLGEEFSHYLNAKRVEGAQERLKALGEPEKVEVESLAERGGMEVALIRFTFKGMKVKGLLYRTPDGKIQQFLIYKS
jgi:CubicO group peptidase (beta-lactamase class C family)